MSIAIDSMKCRACGKCLDVCPGSLIVRGEDKKAVIRYPKDCWGCASCIKECPFVPERDGTVCVPSGNDHV